MRRVVETACHKAASSAIVVHCHISRDMSTCFIQTPRQFYILDSLQPSYTESPSLCLNFASIYFIVYFIKLIICFVLYNNKAKYVAKHISYIPIYLIDWAQKS